MKSLPSHDSANFSTSRQNNTNWSAIYQPFSNRLGSSTQSALAAMRNSRVEFSLSMDDLPQGIDNLSLDRTANSTPAAKHKQGVSLNQGVMITPPVDKRAESVGPHQSFQRGFNRGAGSEMYITSKPEDDVFSETSQPVPTSVYSAPPAGEEVHEYAANNTIAPRSDRLLDPITASNAQGVLPPNCLVFVANLSVNRTDEQLEESCHDAFDKFGPCIIKVRRDRHKHPFAFIQYHTPADANRAVDEGRELMIEGRPVRTEFAESRRSLVLSRVGGGATTSEEARELLGRFGPIEQMQPTTHADARLHGLPEGMWVKFAYHLDFKDCLKAFNSTTNNLFVVTEVPNLEPRTRPVVGGSPVVQQGVRTPRSNVDQKSIFVGNLPEDTTEAELLEIFSSYGQIKGCNIIRKPITGGQGYNIFGFIEYGTSMEAEAAAETEIDIRGQRIRVEPKEYSARRHTRLQPFGQPPSAERAPRGTIWGPSANVYQPPGAPMPYGFQPIFLQTPSGGFAPYHPGYNWTSTPPNSGPRRGVPVTEDYFLGGSPQPQFIPMPPSAFGMTPYRDAQPDEQQPSTRRYR